MAEKLERLNNPKSYADWSLLPEEAPKSDRSKGRGETKRSQYQYQVDEACTLDRKLI